MALGYYNSRFTVSRLFSLPTRRGSVLFCLSPSNRTLHLPFALSCPPLLPTRSRVTEYKREESRGGRGRVSTGGRGWQGRTIREVKPLLPKRIMRGKIKFFSTRPFELHRPRDHALLLLVLYIVYTFRGIRLLPPSLSSSPFPSITLFVAYFRRRDHFRSFPRNHIDIA